MIKLLFMGKSQDEKALRDYFGEYPPETAVEARNALRNAETQEKSFPPIVYLALQNLLCEEMGKKVSPKKRDRQAGQRLRKKRTGSSKG